MTVKPWIQVHAVLQKAAPESPALTVTRPCQTQRSGSSTASLCCGAGSSSAAAEAGQLPGSEEQECINALAQSVLLHPYAVQQLMSRCARRAK